MIGGQAFEVETARRLTALGWSTTPTAVTGDWGADVVGRIGSECVVVQCKDWGGPVGLSAIQEVAFARTHYRAQLAAVVSRSGYTKAAKAAAKTAGVHLLVLEDIRVGASVLDRSEESARRREAERLSRVRAADDERVRRMRAADAEAARVREEKRLLRLREAQARRIESEREESQDWRRFDRIIERRRLLMPWCKRLGVAMIIAGGIGLGSFVATAAMSLLARHKVIMGAFGAGAIVTLGILLISCLLHPPPKAPDIPRRGALRDCPCCESHLGLELGRSGWVTCPHCKWRFHAET